MTIEAHHPEVEAADHPSVIDLGHPDALDLGVVGFDRHSSYLGVRWT